MTAIAIRQTADLGKFAAAVIIALLFLALLATSAARSTVGAAPGVTLNPCKTCSKCPCPKMLGSISCGCPR